MRAPFVRSALKTVDRHRFAIKLIPLLRQVEVLQLRLNASHIVTREYLIDFSRPSHVLSSPLRKDGAAVSEQLFVVLAGLEPFVARKRHISTQAVTVFFLLMEKEGRSMSQLAAKLHIPPSLVTNRVWELRKWPGKVKGEGLAYVVQDDADARVRRVYLTARGKQLAAEVTRALNLVGQGVERA
jgi:DNA-binding MarR family transcriptional regulator